MKVNALVLMVAVGLSAGFSAKAFAEEGKVAAEAKEAGHDMKKSAKKAGRGVKDATCEMVHGKMECAGKKAGHKVQNAVDDVKH